MLAVVALGASALQVSAPVLGGSSQDRNANVTAQFTITNDQTTTLSGISVQIAGDSKYSLSLESSTVPTTLAPNAQATVTVKGFVPLTHNAVDSNTLKAQAIAVGTITVTGNNGSATLTQAVNASVQAKNQLEIKKVRIQCDSTSKSLDNGDTIKNLKPGEDCTLEVEVENLFGNDENAAKTSGIQMNTVDIRVDSASNDVDVDDDNDNIDDLDADDKDSLSFDLNIEDDASARTVSVDITAKGTDENGAVHGEEQTIRMQIERVTHDIQITRVEVSPSRITNCEAGNVKLNVGVLNLGKRNEKAAAVEVSVPELKFTKKSTPVELDQDDETSMTFDVPVPQGRKAGVVRVDVQSFFDTVAPSNTASVDLTVEECDKESTSAPVVVTKPVTGTTTTTQPTSTTPTTVVVPSTSGAQAASKKTESFTDSNAYVALLIVASVVIVLVLVSMVVMLVRRKQP